MSSIQGQYLLTQYSNSNNTERPADTKAAIFNGNTVSQYVSTTNNQKTINLSLEKRSIHEINNSRRIALHDAILKQDVEKINTLIAERVDINAKDNLGRTALHSTSSAIIFNLLVKHGADIHAKDNYGNTPLQYAAVANNQEIINLLFQLGADIHTTNDAGKTAIHNASLMGHDNVTEFLIEQGVSINAQDNLGRTALHRVCYESTFNLLIKHGAYIDAKDDRGNTVLHYSVIVDLDRDGKITFLLKHKADANVINKLGKTALHEAASRGCNEKIEILLENMADINITGVSGTALHSAAKADCKKTVELLLSKGADINARDSVWRNSFTLCS